MCLKINKTDFSANYYEAEWRRIFNVNRRANTTAKDVEESSNFYHSFIIKKKLKSY